ncbi:hypothetical protein B0T18DRAFT_393551 [Schizothecium vesticola]|uniref:Uncharacterized protein n=1 Tax=Schizothecium vesticola TaxID=314040 RepID=A0AA40K014_9PEZI|nr:hypothetical protein B0T18DRAFT_393551 [Schizothecium vesticola]
MPDARCFDLPLMELIQASDGPQMVDEILGACFARTRQGWRLTAFQEAILKPRPFCPQDSLPTSRDSALEVLFADNLGEGLKIVKATAKQQEAASLQRRWHRSSPRLTTMISIQWAEHRKGTTTDHTAYIQLSLEDADSTRPDGGGLGRSGRSAVCTNIANPQKPHADAADFSWKRKLTGGRVSSAQISVPAIRQTWSIKTEQMKTFESTNTHLHQMILNARCRAGVRGVRGPTVTSLFRSRFSIKTSHGFNLETNHWSPNTGMNIGIMAVLQLLRDRRTIRYGMEAQKVLPAQKDTGP